MLSKKLIKIALIGMLATTVWGTSASTYRDFTYLKDHSIHAQILNVDVLNQRILLERTDRETAWVGVNALSQDDRSYISSWYDSQALLSTNTFKVSIDLEQQSARTSRQGEYWQRKTTYISKIALTNLSEKAIENLQIDYCYVINETASETSQQKRRFETGSVYIGSLATGDTRLIRPGSVVLVSQYTLERDSNVFGTSHDEDTIQAEEIAGFWLRIYGSGESGVLAIREICDPEDLRESASWPKPST